MPRIKPEDQPRDTFRPTKGRDKTNLKRFIDDELEEAKYGINRANLPGRDRINRQ